MVYSKIYGFLPPSKVIDVDDGVAAVGYKSPSTPPLLILNRRTPLVATLDYTDRCDIYSHVCVPHSLRVVFISYTFSRQ